MDWKWVWLVLLLLVIAAAVWLLLRRPGGANEVSGKNDPELRPHTDNDTTLPSQAGGYAAGAGAAPGAGAAGAAAPEGPVDDEYGQPAAPPFDQQAGAAPYDQTVDTAPVEDERTSDYAYTDTQPAAEAGDYSQEAAYTDTATGDVAQADTVPQDAPPADPTYGQAPAGDAYGQAPADDAYGQAPADDAYGQAPADDSAYVAETTDPVTQGAEPVDPGTGYAYTDTQPAAEAGDYSQEATYTDTATGEVAQADTVPHDAPPADPTYGQAPAEGGDVEPTTETDYAGAPTAAAYPPAAPVDGGPTDGTPTAAADAGDYGYDEAQAGAAAGSYAQGPFGAGSAEPAEDGSGPVGWSIKGNAGSMLFHTPESPSYEGARAEVWFETEEAARAAGFVHWDRKQR